MTDLYRLFKVDLESEIANKNMLLPYVEQLTALISRMEKEDWRTQVKEYQKFWDNLPKPILEFFELYEVI